jgi:hypothetical protein
LNVTPDGEEDTSVTLTGDDGGAELKYTHVALASRGIHANRTATMIRQNNILRIVLPHLRNLIYLY